MIGDEGQSSMTNVMSQTPDSGGRETQEQLCEEFHDLSVAVGVTCVSLRGLWAPSFYGELQNSLQHYMLAEVCVG